LLFDDELLLRSARLAVEAAPLIAELGEAGVNVRIVWDLVNTAENYANVIPVLLKHLQMPYSDRTREGIARALAVWDPQVRNVLRRSKDPVVLRLLEDLAGDPDLTEELLSWRRFRTH
jgi:hydrogenase maturation factor